MRRYVQVSGFIFAVVTCVQVIRLLRSWPIQIAGIDVPVWASGVAAVLAASLTFWAFRSLASSPANAS